MTVNKRQCAALERIADSLERLCPGGSESGGLLRRSEAEADKPEDGERSRDSCAHCADKAALVNLLQSKVGKWRRRMTSSQEVKQCSNSREDRSFHEGRAAAYRTVIQDVEQALEAAAERA